mgnify:CR=1 FL=1
MVLNYGITELGAKKFFLFFIPGYLPIPQYLLRFSIWDKGCRVLARYWQSSHNDLKSAIWSTK